MAFMGPEEPEPLVLIDSIESGSILGFGDPIPLSIYYDSDEIIPDKLIIELLNDQGEVVAEQVFEDEALGGELPQIDLAELEEGVFSIRFTVYDQDEIINEKELQFFYTDQEYRIEGVVSFPPLLFPDGAGLLYAELNVPEDSDPYLRWSMDGEVIAADYLSAGADRLQWSAPKDEGVFSVLLELFPQGPPEGTEFPFLSPLQMTAEIFVTSEQEVKEGEFSPENNYRVLYHFRGNLINSASSGEAFDLFPLGEAPLALEGPVFGYNLSSGFGYDVSRMVLPLDEEYYLEPFTLAVKAKFRDIPEEGSLFTVETLRGEEQFRIGRNQAGSMEALINFPGKQIISTLPYERIQWQEIHRFHLSVLPGESSYRVLWYADYELVHAEVINEEPAAFSDNLGRSIIGGTPGFSGIIDEFGIYSRNSQDIPSADEQLFYKGMHAAYGNSLPWAFSFRGQSLSESISVSEEQAELEAGALILEEEGHIILPIISLDQDSRVEFRADSDAGSPLPVLHIELFSDDPETILLQREVPLENIITYEGAEVAGAVLEYVPMQGIFFSHGTEPYLLQPEEASHYSLRVTLRNAPDREQVSISTLSAIQVSREEAQRLEDKRVENDKAPSMTLAMEEEEAQNEEELTGEPDPENGPGDDAADPEGDEISESDDTADTPREDIPLESAESGEVTEQETSLETEESEEEPLKDPQEPDDNPEEAPSEDDDTALDEDES